jgi:hypothetical protein
MVSSFEGIAHHRCAVCMGIVRKTPQSILRIVRVWHHDFLFFPFLHRRRDPSQPTCFQSPLLCTRRHRQPMVGIGRVWGMGLFTALFRCIILKWY